MNIELTKEEIEILDQALVEWQRLAGRTGMAASIAEKMLGRAEGIPQDIQKLIAEAKESSIRDGRKREMQAMRLRLKLIEVLHRAGEFESPATPPRLIHERAIFN